MVLCRRCEKRCARCRRGSSSPCCTPSSRCVPRLDHPDDNDDDDDDDDDDHDGGGGGGDGDDDGDGDDGEPVHQTPDRDANVDVDAHACCSFPGE
eukprot:3267520-Rhodomonas_salina.1